MAERRPLVNISGSLQELPTGDTLPGAAAASFFTGLIMPYIGTTSPSGWILATSASAIRTIGSAASGSDYANADAEDLYTLYYNAMTNTEAPVSSGRGANAAADFAANKTLTMPDPRGRSLIGTGQGGSLTSRTHGAVGGAETHQLSTAELAAHNHAFNYNDAMNGVAGNVGAGTQGTTAALTVTNNKGSDTAHNNMQPWAAVNLIIKL